ncbi:putative periplasmic serine endoprotease DegP-like precursor [compost metagenome]|uniref:Probable periplasmic serine endoprotease DegP-like n=1 Tax=Variovorax boronicumulans TaxID=436515 RepID=A0A250DPS6_9BURK|nr:MULTISPECIES: DegQ family serine endoprotease [Variovorax]ATA56264.1 serine peptidase [Variovorax boronicumulans]MDP9910902.1 serine protease Do [Variovorax boronicumulans]MDP9918111.1 serine protease Do [Variovorax boronicumulans]PBI86535.1 putative periplasmic serine endoprotease DegP-like precursor [Variovorax boronicumulans]TSD56123.1 DegQ family serine endoprotease [Variovorax sp. KBS0712]
MMFKVEGHKLRSGLLAFALALTAGATFLPVESVHAQTRTLPDFTDLVDQVGPSVVNIRTVEKVAQRGGGNGEMDEEMQEFFRRFFGQPLPGTPRQGPRPNRPQQEEERPRGVGSGFILTGDGYVMTNAHVVEDASEVLVTLPDKREFKAKIIGADKRTDVAVVKIEATGLPAVKVGDISKLRVGEWVMAIGSPFGLENTVTAGIVSAKQRDTGEYLPFIQTDVAINPGNSGGPLINMRGEVVGINSQIYSRSGGFMGISFSIPIDEAIRVSEQLRTSGRVSRGRIGVQIDQVTKDVAEAIGLGKAQGALVRGVEAGSPGEKAGVEPGDVITKFDGKAIEKPSDLPRLVGNTKPGTKSTLTVFRRGSSRDLSVTIAEIEPDKPAKRATDRDEPAAKPSASAALKSLGLAVSDLSDAQKKELKLKGGVKVDAANDAAARAGLREGDVILAVGNLEVANAREFEAAVAKADKAKSLSVLYRRGDWAQYALIRPAR